MQRQLGQRPLIFQEIINDVFKIIYNFNKMSYKCLSSTSRPVVACLLKTLPDGS
jgi:hypothetical protein